jgi:hypothetical protein
LFKAVQLLGSKRLEASIKSVEKGICAEIGGCLVIQWSSFLSEHPAQG